jgi:hypothetical protein
MTEYDSWLDSLIPNPLPDPKIVELAVPCEFGAFNWQVFTKRYSQNNVQDWAWEACKKGPFTTPYAKLGFAIHLACARIRLLFVERSARWHPLVLASHTARYFMDEDYVEATTEVELTWSDNFTPWAVRAEEEDNGSITIYGKECDDYSLDF